MSRPACIRFLCFLAFAVTGTVFAQIGPPSLDDGGPVPYGAGSYWIVGHELLQAGEVETALSYLQVAYQHDPDAIPVALDFQEALQARGYFQDALGVLGGLVDSHPDSLDFRFKRADLLVRLGKVDEALDDLEVLRKSPDVTEEMVGLEASLLSAVGRVDEALDLLRRGVELFPDRGAAIYLGMASALTHNDRTEDVPALLAQGVERFPVSGDLRLALIRALAGAGRYADAERAAVEADSVFGLPRLDTAPGDPDSLEGLPESFRVELADYYVQNHDLDRGRKILISLDQQGQLSLRPSLWLARLFLSDGRDPEARDLIGRILERWPGSGRAWFLRGRVAEDDGRPVAALADFRKAVELAPDDPELRLTLVRALMRADRASSDPAAADTLAAELCRHVAAAEMLVAPFDSRGQFLVGDGLRRCGDFAGAARHLEMAAEDSTLHFNALVQASLCLDEAGQVDHAREVLERLRKEYPDNPEIANSLGYFLAEKNLDLVEAERLVRIALSADPSNGAFLDSMAWIHYRQGRLTEAFDYLIRAVNVLPDDPIVLEHLGVVLAARGQVEEGRQMLRRALARGGDPDRLHRLLEELDAGDGNQ